MNGTVVERERGALAGAVERAAIRESGLAPLDVGRRERAQRAGHIAEAQVSEVAILELAEKGVESAGQLPTVNC